ncbi:MAG: hypothetical protein ACP6KW_08870 [Candidatus Thorarchaeota archaeon]
MKPLIVVSMTISAIILVVVFMVYVGIPLVSTHFHYERCLDETRAEYVSVDIEDANMTFRFEDYPTLLYRIKVVQYEPGWHHRAFVKDDADSVNMAIYSWDRWGNPEPTCVPRTGHAAPVSGVAPLLATGQTYGYSDR